MLAMFYRAKHFKGVLTFMTCLVVRLLKNSIPLEMMLYSYSLFQRVPSYVLTLSDALLPFSSCHWGILYPFSIEITIFLSVELNLDEFPPDVGF